MTPEGAIDSDDVRSLLPLGRSEPGFDGARLAEQVREFERRAIEAALAAEGGSMTRAAARLGLERSHLYKKMKKLGWSPEESGG